jgi:two-component sensor histidine kinase/CheY-like chemotaxis protein
MPEQTAPVLILAPSGRDAAVAATILGEVGLVSTMCPDLDVLVSGLDRAGGVIVTEEALLHSDRRAFADWIRQQPPWSDFPFVLLTSRSGAADACLTELLGNVTVLERPFHPSVLVNAVRSATRARQRQREAEAYLQERKRSEEHQLLLIRELQHRVKNTLATVQALLRATARSASTVQGFRQVFEARVLSLSRTHDLLVENAWRAAPIRNILRSELGPYDDGAGTRVLLAGPGVELPAELAVPIGMAIHELTTNAAKYGAFSTPRGWLEVEWDVRGHEGTRKLQLWWTERDGPPVEKPSRKGFGSSLIQRLLTTQCRAEIEFAYDRPGLRFQMSVPLVRSARDEIMTLRPGEASSPGRHSPDGGMTQFWRGETSSGPDPETRATLS